MSGRKKAAYWTQKQSELGTGSRQRRKKSQKRLDACYARGSRRQVAPFLRVGAGPFRVATSGSGDEKSEGAGLIEAGVSRRLLPGGPTTQQPTKTSVPSSCLGPMQTANALGWKSTKP